MNAIREANESPSNVMRSQFTEKSHWNSSTKLQQILIEFTVWFPGTAGLCKSSTLNRIHVSSISKQKTCSAEGEDFQGGWLAIHPTHIPSIGFRRKEKVIKRFSILLSLRKITILGMMEIGASRGTRNGFTTDCITLKRFESQLKWGKGGGGRIGNLKSKQ